MMGFKNKWSEERENKYGQKKPKMIVKISLWIERLFFIHLDDYNRYAKHSSIDTKKILKTQAINGLDNY